MRDRAAFLLAVLIPLAAGGCGGIELSALTVAALSAGAGSAVKAGTEYTLTGVAYRTFTVSLEDLTAVVRDQLDRTQFTLESAYADGYELVVVAGGIDRSVHLRFTPITPRVTRLRLAVTKGWIFRDKATASEILAEIERTVSHLNSTVDMR